ncbi:MAG: high frequency lysogenization protein HflD [Xanthomonadales bacterium]|jgi:high frequency lysogenization protein|nr:high frequency lysogenization protein HflD [Xanthomonadales bacterium]MCC6562283.1 high frequency lysogenization protein HflD [Xanthomonadales bacterium]
MNRDREQVLAFAAMFQALGCVQQLAETGRYDTEDGEALLAAIFAIDSPDAESLYPPARMRSGLKLAAQHLDRNPGDAVMRMGITVLRLERRLMTHAKLAGELRERIADIERARSALGDRHETVLARLSDAYLQTVSNLQPRVMVHGVPHLLQQERVVHQIRALLLAAIRAAAMWRHVGGSGWRLFWRRRKWLVMARSLGGG